MEILYALTGSVLVFYWLAGLTAACAGLTLALALGNRHQSRGRRRIEGRLQDFNAPGDALTRVERKRTLYRRAIADLEAEGRGDSPLAKEFRRKLRRLDAR